MCVCVSTVHTRTHALTRCLILHQFDFTSRSSARSRSSCVGTHPSYWHSGSASTSCSTLPTPASSALRGSRSSKPPPCLSGSSSSQTCPYSREVLNLQSTECTLESLTGTVHVKIVKDNNFNLLRSNPLRKVTRK